VVPLYQDEEKNVLASQYFQDLRIVVQMELRKQVLPSIFVQAEQVWGMSVSCYSTIQVDLLLGLLVPPY
jgi:hypothetical protein